MASGLTVVASAVGGTAEAVVNGKTGLLFGKDDENALKIAAKRVVEDPKEAARLGAAARRVCEERYGFAQVATRLEQLYRGET